MADRMLTLVDTIAGRLLDEIVAEGARRMLAAALEAKIDAYVAGFVDVLDEHGHRMAVRNGHGVGRSIVTGAGPIVVEAPRVNNRRVDEATGKRRRFSRWYATGHHRRQNRQPQGADPVPRPPDQRNRPQGAAGPSIVREAYLTSFPRAVARLAPCRRSNARCSRPRHHLHIGRKCVAWLVSEVCRSERPFWA